MEIKSESLATRCEICHQSDMFNAVTKYCGRCQPAFKKTEVDELIWEMKIEHKLLYGSKKSEFTEADLLKIVQHYDAWRRENRHVYESQLNEYLAYKMSLDIMIIKRRAFYNKMRFLQKIKDDDLKKRRISIIDWAGILIVFASIFSLSSYLFCLGSAILVLNIISRYNAKQKSKYFLQLDRYWWRDIDDNQSQILEKYKSE